MSTSFPLDGMRVRFAGATNIGRKRDHNEDSISLPDAERLAIVADGMGGHASGEVASKMEMAMVAEHFKATADEAELTWPFKAPAPAAERVVPRKLDHSYRYDASPPINGIKLANLDQDRQAQPAQFC